MTTAKWNCSPENYFEKFIGKVRYGEFEFDHRMRINNKYFRTIEYTYTHLNVYSVRIYTHIENV